jgi:Uma2 family endonuclease
MSAILTPVSAPPGAPPRPLRWTVADFHRVGETGVFEGRRPVLIRGVLLEQGPMNPPHAIAVELVLEALRAAFGPGWRTRVQLPLVLGLDIDPMPDLAMVAGSPRDTPTHPTTAALVVEVSDTTLALDLTEKAELYATAGIADYWVLDLTGRRLLVFRDPAPVPAGGTAYRTHQTLGPAESATPLAAPNSPITVSDLLP